ncbi:hypothetical protein MKW98_018088, partial [Papaver atlanticum]
MEGKIKRTRRTKTKYELEIINKAYHENSNLESHDKEDLERRVNLFNSANSNLQSRLSWLQITQWWSHNDRKKQRIEASNSDCPVSRRSTSSLLPLRNVDCRQVPVQKLKEREGLLDHLKRKLRKKDDRIEDLETNYNAVLVKERERTHELLEGRRELINGLSGAGPSRRHIGVQRMGELDNRPFHQVCPDPVNAALLCTTWVEKIEDPRWHPFKVVAVGSNKFQ